MPDPVPSDFDDLVRAAMTAPIDGWDFSWLEGRATESRPPWGYHTLAARRIGEARALLDVQTGGGEVLAELLAAAPTCPSLVRATESWPPNAAHARHLLAPLGAQVVEVDDDDLLPFDDATFDLVLSRHPVVTPWADLARVLGPGGTYLAQHVGSGSNRELTDFLMGPQPVSDLRSPERAVADAGRAGLSVRDLQRATVRLEFFDVGAVVYFLRLVVWTVPDFDLERYRERLLALHEVIGRQGSFVSRAHRFLIEAARPG